MLSWECRSRSSLWARINRGCRSGGDAPQHENPGDLVGKQFPGERWVSPELKVVVYSRIEDSVVGVVGYQLRNMGRGEPPAELFQLPTDYTVTFGPYGCWTWDFPAAPDFGRAGRPRTCD